MSIDEKRIKLAKNPIGKEGIETLNRMNDSHEELTLWALSFLDNNNKDINILDVGCGGGATIKRLSNKFNNAFLYGIDYTLEGVDLSKEFNKDNEQCEIVRGDVHNLPYENDKFEIITAFETVYFWEDIKKALLQIKRVLKNDGLFLICCEMSDADNPKWEKALTIMNIYNPESLKTILKENGFEILNTEKNNEWFCIIVK